MRFENIQNGMQLAFFSVIILRAGKYANTPDHLIVSGKESSEELTKSIGGALFERPVSYVWLL